jgi:hypothetical protein
MRPERHTPMTNDVEEEIDQEEEESEDPEEAGDDPDEVADADVVACPECDAEIEEEISRGDLITCPECNCRLEVLDTDPAHLALYVPENEKPQSDIVGRVVGERRPVTNLEDSAGTGYVGLNPVIPDLPSATAFFDSHTTDAIADASKKEDEVFQSGDSQKILRVIEPIVRNMFRKQQLISKIRNFNDHITRILKQVIDEVESGKRFMGHEMRTRLAEDIQAIYDASPARKKFHEHRDMYPDINSDTAGGYVLLPFDGRHPGHRTGGSYGLDPAAHELLDEYEHLAAQASAAVASNRGEKEIALSVSTMGEGPQRGDPEKADDAEPTDRSLDIVLTWENWWDLISADWTVRLRQPSPLTRTLQKFLKEEMDRLDEKAWQAESILMESDPERKAMLAKKYGVSARIDKLEKRGPTGEVILRGAEAAGQYGRNKELAARLGISVGQVENLWREIKALKRFPASKILERAERLKYF